MARWCWESRSSTSQTSGGRVVLGRAGGQAEGVGSRVGVALGGERGKSAAVVVDETRSWGASGPTTSALNSQPAALGISTTLCPVPG